MVFKFSFLVLFFLAFLFFSFANIKAANSFGVAINEIAWMGTNVSANDEWIELYNNTANNINLEGWVLKSGDGAPEIKLTGMILVNDFFLLERTDDETVAGVAADQIYKGALGNNGENLKLFDNSGNLIDLTNCSAGWFAGDNKTKQTMERKNPQTSGDIAENWQTSQNPGGTPKSKNSKQTVENQRTEEQITEKLAEAGSPPIYPGGIVLNEILPSPEGSDTEEEWIEIFNQNNFEVDLTGWKIKDTSGKATTYAFPKGTKISGQGFLVLSRPETKITLNNDEDGLTLASPAGKIVNEINYKKAPRGESYNRLNSDWVWNANLTPGAPNTAEKTDFQSPEDKEKKELAAVGEPFRQAQAKQSRKSLFVFLIALGLAIFSGIIVLILKKKIKKDLPI